METKKELKKYFRTLGIIYTADYVSERLVRKAISELRKEGMIFIPSDIGKGVYVEVSHASETEIKKYTHSQIRHFETQYFNTMLPMKRFVKDLDQVKLFGRLEGIIKDEPHV